MFLNPDLIERVAQKYKELLGDKGDVTEAEREDASAIIEIVLEAMFPQALIAA